MKAIPAVHNGQGFTGMIRDEETYNKLKNGELDWKPNTKAAITRYTIPAAVFIRLLELDRQQSAPKEVQQDDSSGTC